MLPFRLLSAQARLPTRAHEGDAGLDLYAAEAAAIAPGARASVGTGVAVALPPGTAGLVVPRSGTAARHGIALVNAPGVVDAGYRGELRVLLLNTDTDATFTIAPGDRVAQLMVVRVELLQPVAAEELGASARGNGGFGSSGR
ncbi:MAG TPA: dUTP diphosphatase [Solirubrobacteraceae bacterium]|nr:dUTP diphosphatase [Solirubrobacteraceae bacterium]